MDLSSLDQHGLAAATGRVVVALALAALLGTAGCDDSDDYSWTSENCYSVDLGEGEEYELCCKLKCKGEYDYDDYHEECTETYYCTGPTDDPCPHEIIEEYGYPSCVY
jgi:hypothetical protein